MFDYITKVNKRSKRIKLQYCHYRGLIITSPKRLSKKRLDAICNEQQDWINKQRENFPLKDVEKQPNELTLLALQISYQLSFKVADKNSLVEADNHLMILGPDSQHQIKRLKRWVRKKATLLMAERLEEWAVKMQLNYSKLSVRSQKSRWGSCSSTGTISLNDQLLFMPASILDYIIVHELCHTVQPNHSARYWALVAQHYPDYKQQERLLAEYAKKIPTWFRASLY